MMKCYLDSNVLVYFQNVSAPEHRTAVDLLIRLREARLPVFLSPLCLDEAIHATLQLLRRKKAGRIYPELTRFLARILALPRISIVHPPSDLNAHKTVVNLMETYNLRPRDAYHLLTMRANGIDGFATFDNDFSVVFDQKILTHA